MENDLPAWTRESRGREWIDSLRRGLTDALYEVIDAGFRIAAKFGRPSPSHRTREESRQR